MIGPFRDTPSAERSANRCVDHVPGQTQQHVIEIFGEDDRPAPPHYNDGEVWGVLYVASDEELEGLDERLAEQDKTYQVIDTEGYEWDFTKTDEENRDR